MAKHHNITEDAFRFIKNRCIHCKKIIPHNQLFCSKECRDSYFEKNSKIINEAQTNKKQSKRRVGLYDLLSEENLKAMIEKTEQNIDKKKRN